MNKRFYDIAKHTLAHRYLVLKSYYSQAAIFVTFLIFGIAVIQANGNATILTPVYWVATPAALIYLIYGAKRYQSE